jgi:hypothetical protein
MKESQKEEKFICLSKQVIHFKVSEKRADKEENP